MHALDSTCMHFTIGDYSMSSENAKPHVIKPRGNNSKVRDRCTTTAYLPTSWPDYQKLVKDKFGCSGSERLSQLMLKDLAELQGKTMPSQENIKSLEMEVSSLIRKCKTIGQYLAKHGVYHQLENLVDREFKLAADFKNLDDVAKLMLEYVPKRSDDFGRDDLELMLQLLNLNRQKLQQKKMLDDIRLGRYVAPTQPVVATVLSAGAPVSKPENVVVAPTSELTPIVSTQPPVSLDNKLGVAPIKEVTATVNVKPAVSPVERLVVAQTAEQIQEGVRKINDCLKDINQKSKGNEEVKRVIRPIPEPIYVFKKGEPEIKLPSNKELSELNALFGDDDLEAEESEDSEADKKI
jgi:hypothetical protein